MEQLVSLLLSIETNNEIKSKFGFIPETNTDVRDASILASSLLITDLGECNWRNIELLKMEGFDVFPIEKDRFGWLVAGIQTRKGVISYS